MSLIVDMLVTDLRALIRDLGKDGGLMSPSIYDTAQALRFQPPEDIWPAVNWLLAQQQPDGGWGNPALPLSRTVPTLASLLALQTYCTRNTTLMAIKDGFTFLRRQLGYWTTSLPDDLPVGIELLLPRLLEDANELGVMLRQEPYAELLALGQRRRTMIAKLNPGAGTTAAYSWEAWGAAPDTELIDPSGGVGHSPAATAAWLRAALDRRNPKLAPYIKDGRAYLAGAAQATSEHTLGVLPTAWPITRFEQSFGLYALQAAGLLNHPALSDVVEPQIADLRNGLTPAGIGYSDFFKPDGDDTAAAVAVLHGAGYELDRAILRQFEQDGCFATYSGELQPSISVTARAVHALTLVGEDVSRWWDVLVSQQRLDGSWGGDKWNNSWLYTTYHVLLALRGSPAVTAMKNALDALHVYQHDDGGWGLAGRSTTVETAYATLSLHTLLKQGLLDEASREALRRGYNWLLHHYRPFRLKVYKCWLNKEVYCPQRVDHAFELSAMLTLALEDEL